MPTLRSILDAVREAALSFIGSPHSRSRQLAALRKLDAHLLKDIGLTPEEVERATIGRSPIHPAPRRPLSLDVRTPFPNR